MKSKKPDSLEIQIMKSQAQEIREQKHVNILKNFNCYLARYLP